MARHRWQKRTHMWTDWEFETDHFEGLKLCFRHERKDSWWEFSDRIWLWLALSRTHCGSRKRINDHDKKTQNYAFDHDCWKKRRLYWEQRSEDILQTILRMGSWFEWFWKRRSNVVVMKIYKSPSITKPWLILIFALIISENVPNFINT